jgi:hypothetical protein
LTTITLLLLLLLNCGPDPPLRTDESRAFADGDGMVVTGMDDVPDDGGFAAKRSKKGTFDLRLWILKE